MQGERILHSFAEQPVLPREGAINLDLNGDNASVHDGLRVLMAKPSVAGLTEDTRGSLEIILAEVLNNVVEHAYRDGPGPIRIYISRRPDQLVVSVYDQGAPMPDLQMPKGELAPLDPDDLPEGGFGWFLIRTLTQDLSYERLDNRNHLRFSVPMQSLDVVDIDAD